MIYEIINMSDPYTIEAHDLKIAAVACVLLGRGQYGFAPIDSEGEEVPIMLFGGVDEWFRKQFGTDLGSAVDGVMQNRRNELADCLDSCLIGDLKDRMDYDAAVAAMSDSKARNEFRAARHDRRRTSLNDIGARSYAMAERLRNQSDQPVMPAPQQVFAQ